MILASRQAGRLSGKSGRSRPSASKRRSRSSAVANPAERGTFRKRAGRSWSVLRLATSSGQAVAVSRMNLSMRASYLSPDEQRPHVGEPPGHRRRRYHGRRHQMGARARPLPPAEIAVGGRGAAFARRHQIAVDADAHGAARFAPFEAGVAEDAVEPFLLGLALDGG